MTIVADRNSLPAAFFNVGSSSFVELLQDVAPELLTRTRSLPQATALNEPAHATTIVAMRYADGVLMAGDRRATIGSLIAHREIDKVFQVDEHSVVGIAGTAGIALELVRIFQLEVEHFEKIEGVPLSLDGKANRLATMTRQNLALAMQGLAAVPLFAGFDTAQQLGRIYSYDVTGGRYLERDFYSVGSGAAYARSALKKLWSTNLSRQDAILTAVHALADAAEEDSGTGGPDLIHKIWPVVATVDASGFTRVGDEELAQTARRVADRLVQGNRPGTAQNGDERS
ncbi:proteasome beta subunit [Micrococcales bacterium KH10]|nr:proteasome beta subunit [Micrococcales bacterium KH10]